MDDKMDFRERGSIFKQMGEMKKKIQLVEGERKAVFEDCEREKKENKENIKKLKEEIKQLQSELRDRGTSSEPILRHVQDKKYLDVNVLKRKSGDDAVETMDYKVADLRKKLNKMKYLTKAKSDKIALLLKEYEKLVTRNMEMEKAEEIMEESDEGQRLRFLENEIHKTNLKLMEGETIRKKYNTILDMLKRERLTFGNQLESLEGNLKKQDEEIEKLKKTHQSALVTRDLARQNQHKKEIALLSEGKEREKRLIEYRKTAEDRKNYFESMERHMFASKTSIKETGRESISTSDHAHDGRGSEAGSVGGASNGGDGISGSGGGGEKRSSGRRGGGAGGSGKDDDGLYEEAFAKMKKAAGVSELEDVVKRFLTQEETAKHLQELQLRAEKEIRDLGAIKEKLEAEWEVVKFMGQEENTELRDKMEELEDKIAEEQCRKKAAEEKLQSRNKLLVGIREGLDRITEKLFLHDPTTSAGLPVPVSRNSIDLLKVSQSSLDRLMARLGGVNLFAKKLEMEEEEFVPQGLMDATGAAGGGAAGAAGGGGGRRGVGAEEEKNKDDKKDDVDSGPEEEEVPTRGYLKRQANLIVDAKSRSKRGNRRR